MEAAAPALTLKTSDTYPTLLGSAADKNGLVNLSGASSLKVRMRYESTVIEGTALAIWPAITDGEGVERNWEYSWALNDTSKAGLYLVELHVVWNASSSPPSKSIFPNGPPPSILIETAQ